MGPHNSRQQTHNKNITKTNPKRGSSKNINTQQNNKVSNVYQCWLFFWEVCENGRELKYHEGQRDATATTNLFCFRNFKSLITKKHTQEQSNSTACLDNVGIYVAPTYKKKEPN